MAGFHYRLRSEQTAGFEPADSVELRAGWDELAGELDHPFLTSGWLAPWWQEFAPPGARSAVVETRDAVGLTLAAPLLRHAHGRSLYGYANVHTPISGVIRAGRASGVALPLPQETTRLVWPSLNHAEALATAADLSGSGWLPAVEPQHCSPVVEMCDSASAYAASRGAKLRQRAGRLERKLAREHHASFVFGHPAANRRLFEESLQLEAFGWKGRRSTAILSDQRTARFYRAIAATPAARLAAIASPDGPISFALCLLHRDRLYLLKTGYDEHYRSLSPGFVLQFATIALCHDLELAGYELLGAADPWKIQLANRARPISRLVAHRNTLPGLVRTGVRKARPLAKSLHARVISRA